MRIAYVTNVKIPANDAQSVQVTAMARAFSSHLGEDFVLISAETAENKDAKTDFQWIRVKVPMKAKRPVRYLSLVLKSISHVNKFKPDYIHSRAIGVVFFYKLMGKKCVYEIHKPFQTKVGNILFRYLSKKILIVAISKALREYVIDAYGVRAESIISAHDGVFLRDYRDLSDDECRQKLIKEIDAPQDAFVILYSSNLYRGKGLELVVEAAKRLPEVIFAIMGRKDSSQIDGAEFPLNLRYINRKPPEEVPFFTKGADALIIPFTRELFTWRYHSAMKMFEYMASGKPVITSNIGTLLEIFNSKNAYLFDPEDIDQFVEKVEEVRKNYDKAKKKAKLAREEVEEYTWEKRTERILRFL